MIQLSVGLYANLCVNLVKHPSILRWLFFNMERVTWSINNSFEWTVVSLGWLFTSSESSLHSINAAWDEKNGSQDEQPLKEAHQLY